MRSLTIEQELKLYLLACGVKIDPKAEKEWLRRYGGPLSLSEYASTSGICLLMASGDYINAPFIEFFTQATKALLSYEEEFFILMGAVRFPVTVIPVPGYHQQTYADGGRVYSYTNLGVTHTDRCRVSPVEGCSWVCTFCDMPYNYRYRLKPERELLRVIELAKDDPFSPARHVLVSGGTPKPEDYKWWDSVVEYLAQNSPLPVDVMMAARTDMGEPRWLRSVGVNMLSVNLEVWDTARSLKITHNKARILGRRCYLDFIERAVESFGVGFVQSLLVFGEAVEPIESTLEGVRALVDRGCIPVLSPFRPNQSTPMGKESPASIEEMKEVYIEATQLCEKSGLGIRPGPRCIPCQHNVVAFCEDLGFYVPMEESLTDREWQH